MQIDILKLNIGTLNSVSFDINYSFSEEELKDTNILELKNVSIKGTISKNIESYNLIANVEGIMILPCSITLKPTKYPFNIEIDEILTESLKKNTNTLDIFSIIWENILMEIPLRVINEEVADSDIPVEGNGWRFITNEDERINPELEKLKDLL